VDIGAKVTGNKRIQKSYCTKAEATAELAKLLNSLRSHGNEALDFTPANWRSCKEAIRMLEEKGFPASQITDAVAFFLDQNNSAAMNKTVAAVCNEYMESKRQAGLATFTLKGYSWKVDRFSKDFGSRVLNEITAAEIEHWFNSEKFTGRHRSDFRRHLTMLWKFAITRDYCRRNVAASITRVKVPQTTPAILTADDVRKLMCAARDHNMGSMLPFFAIGCFCGIRPTEIQRTEWNNINFETKQIYVSKKAAKTGQDRFVDMPENLIAWMALVPQKVRTGCQRYSRAEFEAVRKNSGVIWQIDIMRHSAASHLYAKTHDSGLVTAQMGHELNVFLKHYRQAVTQKDGEAYFTVGPNEPLEKSVPPNV